MSFHDYVRKGGGMPRVQGGKKVDSVSVPNRGPSRANAGEGDASTSGRGVESIASIIFSTSSKVTRFKRMIDALGGPTDTVSHRKSLKVTADDIIASADKANHLLKTCSTEQGGTAATPKLVSDLRGVLYDFYQAQQLCAKWEAAYEPKPDFVPEEAAVAEADPGHEERLQLLQEQKAKSQRLDREIEHREAILEERDRGIREIQQQIGEVNEIFRDLAVLVNDQGEQLYDIEEAVVNAADRTKQAEEHLQGASRFHRKQCTYLLVLLCTVGIGMFVLFALLH